MKPPLPWRTEAQEHAGRGLLSGSDTLIVDRDGLPVADCSPERGHQSTEREQHAVLTILAAVNDRDDLIAQRAALLAERDRLQRLLKHESNRKQRLLDFVTSWIERCGDGRRTTNEFLDEASKLVHP